MENKNEINIKNEFKIVWNTLFGILVSIIAGSYIGLSSKSLKESWIYCWVFLLLAIGSALTSVLARTYTTRKIVISFVLYFLICGLSSPVSSWLGFQLT